MGWDGIEEHYHANWRIVRRWIDETGREQLKRDRAAYVVRRRHEQKLRLYEYRMAVKAGQVSPPPSPI